MGNCQGDTQDADRNGRGADTWPPCKRTEEFHPVCGTDGITYENPNHANCEKVKVAYEGHCVTAREEDAKAESDGAMERNEDKSWSPCSQTEELEPVCGTDGITYPNANHANCAKVKVEYFGECVKAEEKGKDDEEKEEEEDAVEEGEDGTKKEDEKAESNGAKKRKECAVSSDTKKVCGEDGKTHHNASHAECEGIKVKHEGACKGNLLRSYI